MATFPRLIFDEIVAPGSAFHAAMATIPSESTRKVRKHGHDYFEWMIVLEGAATHSVNGTEFPLCPGQLILVRPRDIHSVQADGDKAVSFVNIAFPTTVWRDFVCSTGIGDLARTWETDQMPVSADLSPHRWKSVESEAISALRWYHRSPTRLAFSHFWTAAVEALADTSAGRGTATARPPWLSDVLTAARSVDLSELSLKTLTDPSGVSFAHLCRTMKSCLGVTPTQYINELRISRAAYELAMTDREITRIALDCGFENLSYFYRRFLQAHNKTPRQYRLRARRPLPV